MSAARKVLFAFAKKNSMLELKPAPAPKQGSRRPIKGKSINFPKLKKGQLAVIKPNKFHERRLLRHLLTRSFHGSPDPGKCRHNSKLPDKHKDVLELGGKIVAAPHRGSRSSVNWLSLFT
jgi:hypothetical protein